MRVPDEATVQMAERRRLNRMAERDVADWLYARFLNDKAGTIPLRGGDHRRQPRRDARASGGQWRGRLYSGPVPPCRARRTGVQPENGTVQIKGEVVYKVTDVIDVTIAEVRMETRSIIARPAV